MLQVQQRGCHNINLVTPTHFTPQIVDALILAVEKRLELPIVYNCGGYESVETLKLLEDIVAIYMPDIKYSIDENALKYSGAQNYWETVKLAVKEMHRQVGDLKIRKTGIAKRGLLVRHLVLPNDIAGSKAVIDFIAHEISTDTGQDSGDENIHTEEQREVPQNRAAARAHEMPPKQKCLQFTATRRQMQE